MKRMLIVSFAVCFSSLPPELPPMASMVTAAEPKDLFVLSIGIEPDLTAQGKRDWYARDAEYIRKALVSAEHLYQTVHSRVLNGKKATRSNVLKGLDWLAKEMESNDVGVVFFSAHGDVDSKGYHIFLAHSQNATADDKLWGKELNQALVKMRGKVIVLIDTCRAGAVVTPTTAKQHRAAFVVACRSSEVSSGQWERPDRPHGYFVIAACEALKGRADKNADGIVTFREFSAYLPARATAFYSDQHAVTLPRDEFKSIPLARVDPAFSPPMRTVPNPPDRVVEIKPFLADSKRRNPFGVPDVFDPDGEDVEKFATEVKLDGGEKDANAKSWSTQRFPKSELIDGKWESRWNGGSATNWSSGVAQVKTVGKRVYILYEEDGSRYLIDTRRHGENQLVGRYVNLAISSDSSPWVGRIVTIDRIDGVWKSGRWDLRRKFSAERKNVIKAR